MCHCFYIMMWEVWDVVVQDTHVLARMFAATMDGGWMDVCVLPL
jgi:hypothetical protein